MSGLAVLYGYPSQNDVGAPSQGIWDLRDRVSLTHEVLEDIRLSITFDLDLIFNGRGESGIANVVAPDRHSDLADSDPALRRLPEQVIRDTTRDREVKELTSVEPKSSTTGICRSIRDQRVRTRRAYRRRRAAKRLHDDLDSAHPEAPSLAGAPVNYER